MSRTWISVVCGPALIAMFASASALAGTYDLVIDNKDVNITGRDRPAMMINGILPAPTLRFTEGEEVVINVTNKMDVDTSVHWHGFILPPEMDGVPGISYDGIKPGQTFVYRFKISQNGTYWYHSHSGLQEQAGVYGAIVIAPKSKEPVKADRDYVVMLSDWTDEPPARVLGNLKKQSDYYNYNKRTVFDFFRDVERTGLGDTVENRLMWGEMRMDPTDIADVTGYTFLVNGRNPDRNWTGLFHPGERVRLRFINGSAMSYFDVKIPGLKMTVVAADGQHVRPVKVDQFRISVAETFDVIVEPAADRAYTIFADAMDRSGYARATLAPRPGMTAPIPEPGERPLLTMADMGGAHGAMEHADMPGMERKMKPGMDHSKMPGMKKPGKNHSPMPGMKKSGMDHSEMPAMKKHDGKTGMGPAGKMTMAHDKTAMAKAEESGPRVLQYRDLKSLIPYPQKKPEREIEMKLTGNMERYFWSINGKKYSEAEPIRLAYNERIRVKFVNTTMMNHPMHLHGHWMELDNGAGVFRPRKHVINVKPGETVYFDMTADAIGEWAFHCHLLYHMATGMFRKVIVEDLPHSS